MDKLEINDQFVVILFEDQEARELFKIYGGKQWS